MHISETRFGNMTASERWNYLTRGCDPEKLSRFVLFDSMNPSVYASLEKRAAEQWNAGWRKTSVWLLLNIERWGPGSTVDMESSFKISNDYFAFYSRKLLSQKPHYINWIELKSMKGQTLDYTGDSYSGKKL